MANEKMAKAIKEEIEEQIEEEIESTPKKQIKSSEAVMVDVPTQTTSMIKLEDGSIVGSLELQIIDHNILLKILRSVA